MLNWQSPDDYQFTNTLSREQWAWEFLRRNPDYRREWKTFWETWQALEADYGKAPNRDFQRWKLDPRAYVLEGEDEDCVGSDSCKVDGNKILIECHLGARWGFYKFPLDPATDMPVIGKDLLWRDVEREVVQIEQGDDDWLGGKQSKIALGFDLALPLKEQLEVAKRYLIAMQHWMRREEGITMQTIASLRERLTLCLRLLDGLEQSAERGVLSIVLFPNSKSDEAERMLIILESQAVALMHGEYRNLLLIPEN
jgi:hypothetical protein